MEKTDLLRLREVRAAYRLIGECRELGRDPVAWRRHMLEHLRLLIGARVGMSLQLRRATPDDDEIAEPLDDGFLESSHRALWAHYQREKAHRDDPFHLHYYRNFTGALRTRSLASVVATPEWRRSRHYNDYVRACDCDDRITSSWQLDDTRVPTIQVTVLHRAAADREYPPRAARLVHLFHQELRSIVGTRLSLQPASQEALALPAQLQRVLACLLQGDQEKQVASRLGLSRHTVNRHVQRLFRQFGVHTRPELMVRCREMSALLPEDPRPRDHPQRHG